MNAGLEVDWVKGRSQWARGTGPVPFVDEQVRAIQVARENMRLAAENERLRTENADLAASARLWIRLYEAALARAAARSAGDFSS